MTSHMCRTCGCGAQFRLVHLRDRTQACVACQRREATRLQAERHEETRARIAEHTWPGAWAEPDPYCPRGEAHRGGKCYAHPDTIAAPAREPAPKPEPMRILPGDSLRAVEAVRVPRLEWERSVGGWCDTAKTCAGVLLGAHEDGWALWLPGCLASLYSHQNTVPHAEVAMKLKAEEAAAALALCSYAGRHRGHVRRALWGDLPKLTPSSGSHGMIVVPRAAMVTADGTTFGVRAGEVVSVSEAGIIVVNGRWTGARAKEVAGGSAWLVSTDDGHWRCDYPLPKRT